MRNVIMWNMVTLDGFFEGSKPWDINFHEYVWGEELERFSLDQMASGDTILFGRKTYEGMASYWPSATGQVADIMNGISKIVFSSTLNQATWNNTRLVKGAAEDEVARLKQQDGKDILLFGSADLCAGLLRRGLFDEVRLALVPVLLGAGNPLFKSGEETRMTLLEARPLSTGCVILRYRPGAAA